jgi:hypothetical protein
LGILVFAGAALSHATMRDRVEVIAAKIKIKKPDSAMGTLAEREMTTCNPKSESEREAVQRARIMKLRRAES